MQSHPDARAALQQLREQLPGNDHEQRLLSRLPTLLTVLKEMGQGYLSVRVSGRQLVSVDVSFQPSDADN